MNISILKKMPQRRARRCSMSPANAIRSMAWRSQFVPGPPACGSSMAYLRNSASGGHILAGGAVAVEQSPVLRKPQAQFVEIGDARERLVLKQRLLRVRPVDRREPGHARRPRHAHVMGGVAYHQRPLAPDVQLFHE